MAKVSEMICDVLVECGIDHVFSVPGFGTAPILDSLFDRQDKIRVITTRHEQAAACMAEMYGRITRMPAVLMGQGPFIGTSGAFGILEAYMSNSPMLVISDTSDHGSFSQHGASQSGSGEYGSFDVVNMFRSMSKYTTLVATPTEAVQGVQLAIKHATTGRPGPACVVCRNHAFAGEVDLGSLPRIYATKGYLRASPIVPPEEDVIKVVDLLMQSKKPVIIAGNGVHISKAYQELKELAEIIVAPVATSSKGKSSIPEVHPLALGIMGTYGQKVANIVVSDADLLLVAGCHLGPNNTKFESLEMINPIRQKIIQIDIDPRNAGWTYPIDAALIGDLRLILRQIIEALKDKHFAGVKGRTEALQELKHREDFFDAPELYSDASPLLPQRIIREISNAIDPSTIITLDAGSHGAWMSHFFKSLQEGTTFSPGGIGGMGWGPAAAIAVKLLHPHRPVLSVVGDGGFAMMLNILSTAVQYNLPIIFVVMNNSCYSMVRDHQGSRAISVQLAETDFTKIAEGFGCHGIKVEQASKLAQAMKQALEATVPTVIDVITDKTESHFKITT